MFGKRLERTALVSTPWICAALICGCVGADSVQEHANSTRICSYEAVMQTAEDGEPGTLLCDLPFSSPQISGNGTRIFYVSEDEKGRREAVSAAVIVPDGKPPVGGWPIIAWAHGTVGIAKGCAPSQRPNLFFEEYADAVNAFAQAGYLVVASDYEGLGASGFHKYLQLATESRNVVDAVAAARALVPEAGENWVTVGHSQGGHAALGVGELSPDRMDAKHYLGTVAFAPAANLDQAPEILASYAPSDGYDLLMFVASAIERIYPDFRPSDLLAPELVEYLPKAQSACDDELIEDLMRFPQLEHALAEHWADNSAIADFLATNEPVQLRNAAPILLLQGSNDQLVPAVSSQIVRERACALGSTIGYREYSGESHDSVLVAGMTDALQWIAERFAGRDASADCTP